MNILITRDDAAFARDEGSVIVVTGTDAETGDLVTFAGDHRPMRTMLEGVFDGLEVSAEVEDHQVLRRVPLRKGRVARSMGGNPIIETVSAYLPGNYHTTTEDDQWVYFEGHDNAGWTMEDYVIPRMASGLIWAEEVKSDEAR